MSNYTIITGSIFFAAAHAGCASSAKNTRYQPIEPLSSYNQLQLPVCTQLPGEKKVNPSDHRTPTSLYGTMALMVNSRQINISAITARLDRVSYSSAQPIIAEMKQIEINREDPTDPKIAALAAVAFDWYYGKLTQSTDPNAGEVRRCLEGILKR